MVIFTMIFFNNGAASTFPLSSSFLVVFRSQKKERFNSAMSFYVILYTILCPSILSSLRSRPSPATVCPPVRSPDPRRLSAPQAPEQNTLGAPSPEPAGPAHTSAATAAQHTAAGEAQTADTPGKGQCK